MKQIKYFALSSTLAFLPMVAGAQPTYQVDGSGAVSGYLAEILNFINAVLIPFILGIAFLIFVWGMFQYFIAGATNEDSRKNGQNLIIYAILGFVLILVFWGIVNLVAGATGLTGGTFDPTLTPQAPTLP